MRDIMRRWFAECVGMIALAAYLTELELPPFQGVLSPKLECLDVRRLFEAGGTDETYRGLCVHVRSSAKFFAKVPTHAFETLRLKKCPSGGVKLRFR